MSALRNPWDRIAASMAAQREQARERAQDARADRAADALRNAARAGWARESRGHGVDDDAAWVAAIRRILLDSADRHHADPDDLLDVDSEDGYRFVENLDALVDADPHDPSFARAVESVAVWYTGKHPHLVGPAPAGVESGRALESTLFDSAYRVDGVHFGPDEMRRLLHLVSASPSEWRRLAASYFGDGTSRARAAESVAPRLRALTRDHARYGPLTTERVVEDVGGRVLAARW